MNKSKRTPMSHFQNFTPCTFLDNFSLKKNLVDGLYFYAPLPKGTNWTLKVPIGPKGKFWTFRYRQGCYGNNSDFSLNHISISNAAPLQSCLLGLQRALASIRTDLSLTALNKLLLPSLNIFLDQLCYPIKVKTYSFQNL